MKADGRLLLAIDTGSPVVSVAVAAGERVLATREGAQRESSAALIGWIDEALQEAGTTLAHLGGAVALRGPGSFTGLRVGLATLLGFHQAIDLPVSGLPTLEVLAAATVAGVAKAGAGRPGGAVLALVPAGPGEWFAQVFRGAWPPVAAGEPRRVAVAELPALLAGDAVERIAVATAEEAGRLGDVALGNRGRTVVVTGALAPVAARLAALREPDWDAALLSAPLYLAPPPVSVPGAPKKVMPEGPERRR